MQHNGAVNSNAPDTAEDGCSLASREGLWQRNSVESTLVRAVRTPSALKAAYKATLWGMFVLPARRDRGLALQLMRTAIEHARMVEGVASLHLCVSDAAPDAQRLYERVGFTTWDAEPDAIRVAARSLKERVVVYDNWAAGYFAELCKIRAFATSVVKSSRSDQ
jgi:predicted GNAT family N-acyltransferase